MKTTIILLIIVLFAGVQSAGARDRGCVFNNVVLTQEIGIYAGVPLFLSNNAGCGGTFIDSSSPLWHEAGGNGTCQVWICDKNQYKASKIGIVDTPLDDYALVITFGVAGLAFFSIRRREYDAETLSRFR